MKTQKGKELAWVIRTAAKRSKHKVTPDEFKKLDRFSSKVMKSSVGKELRREALRSVRAPENVPSKRMFIIPTDENALIGWIDDDGLILSLYTVPRSETGSYNFSAKKALHRLQRSEKRKPTRVLSSNFSAKDYENAAARVWRQYKNRVGKLSRKELRTAIIKSMLRKNPIGADFSKALTTMIRGRGNPGAWADVINADIEHISDLIRDIRDEANRDDDPGMEAEYRVLSRYEGYRSIATGIYEEVRIPLNIESWRSLVCAQTMNEDIIFFIEDAAGRVVDFENRKNEFNDFVSFMKHQFGESKGEGLVKELRREKRKKDREKTEKHSRSS